jgi:hypothetical protein
MCIHLFLLNSINSSNDFSVLLYSEMDCSKHIIKKEVVRPLYCDINQLIVIVVLKTNNPNDRSVGLLTAE